MSTDIRALSYAAIVLAVLDGELTADEADAEFRRRAGHVRVSSRAGRTHLAASSKDDNAD